MNLTREKPQQLREVLCIILRTWLESLGHSSVDGYSHPLNYSQNQATCGIDAARSGMYAEILIYFREEQFHYPFLYVCIYRYIHVGHG